MKYLDKCKGNDMCVYYICFELKTVFGAGLDSGVKVGVSIFRMIILKYGNWTFPMVEFKEYINWGNFQFL